MKNEVEKLLANYKQNLNLLLTYLASRYKAFYPKIEMLNDNGNFPPEVIKQLKKDFDPRNPKGFYQSIINEVIPEFNSKFYRITTANAQIKFIEKLTNNVFYFYEKFLYLGLGSSFSVAKQKTEQIEMIDKKLQLVNKKLIRNKLEPGDPKYALYEEIIKNIKLNPDKSKRKICLLHYEEHLNEVSEQDLTFDFQVFYDGFMKYWQRKKKKNIL